MVKLFMIKPRYFMSNIKEIILASVLPAFKEAGKVEMRQVLAEIKQSHEPDIYNNILLGLYYNFSVLQEVTVNTKTKIDDGIVTLVLEAVKETADAEKISLS